MADGRKTEGVKTEAIISPLRKKKWGLPSHSVQVSTDANDSYFHVRVQHSDINRNKADPETAASSSSFSWKGLTFAVVSP